MSHRTDNDPAPATRDSNSNAEADAEAHAETRTTRATKDEMEARLAEVRRWIRTEGIAFEDAIGRLQDRYTLGRRQAVRVWRRGLDPLLSDEDRRRAGRPRDRQGRYTTWPSLKAHHEDP